MNMLNGMNKALDYIEENLKGEIDYALMARIACCSQYHFQRFFASVTDIPLSEYIRRRRLTLAALELQNCGSKVIDAAVKYGYNSADAFSRAFQTMHGILPSRARETGVCLKAYPRLTFTLSIKGVVALNYRIEKRESFTVAGIKEWFTTENDIQYKQIPEMWSRRYADGNCEKILKLSDRDPSGLLGICAEMYDNGFDYWIAAATKKDCPPELQKKEIPASTWAIFEVVGALPKAMHEVWTRIFAEWMPNSGYEHAQTAEIEWSSLGDTSAPTYKSEIWIPVIKK